MRPRPGTPVPRSSRLNRRFSHQDLYRWDSGKDAGRADGHVSTHDTRELCTSVWAALLRKSDLPFLRHYWGLERPPSLEQAWPSVEAVMANTSSKSLDSQSTLRSYFFTWKNNFKKKKAHYKIKLANRGTLLLGMYSTASPSGKKEAGDVPEENVTNATLTGFWILSKVALEKSCKKDYQSVEIWSVAMYCNAKILTLVAPGARESQGTPSDAW